MPGRILSVGLGYNPALPRRTACGGGSILPGALGPFLGAIPQAESAEKPGPQPKQWFSGVVYTTLASPLPSTPKALSGALFGTSSKVGTKRNRFEYILPDVVEHITRSRPHEPGTGAGWDWGRWGRFPNMNWPS